MLRRPAIIFVLTLTSVSVLFGYIQYGQSTQTHSSKEAKTQTSIKSSDKLDDVLSAKDAISVQEQSARVQFTGLLNFENEGRVEGVGTITIDPTGNLYFQDSAYYIDEQGNIKVSAVSSGKYSYEGDISIAANRFGDNTTITIVNEEKGYEANLKIDGSIDVGGSRVTFASGERIDAKKDDTLRLTADGDIMLVLGDTEGAKALKVYDAEGKEKIFEVDSNGSVTAKGSAKFDKKLTVKSGGASITGSVLLNGNTQIGSSSSDVLTLYATLGSNIVPSQASTYSLGTASNPFSAIYADSLVATSTEIAGTTSESITLDSDNTGGDLSLIFGTLLDEQLYWNSTSSRFQMTDDLHVDGNLIVGGTQIDAGSVSALNLGAGTIDFNGSGTVQYATGSIFVIRNDAGNAVLATDVSNNLTLGSNTTTTSIQSSDWDITATGVGTGFDSWAVDSLVLDGNTLGINTDTDLLSFANNALTVNGSAYITGALYDSTNSAGSSGQVLQSTGTGTDWVQLSAGTQLLPTGTEGQTLYNNAGVWTANSGLFYDDVTSRVGIGTTSPGTVLDIRRAVGTNGTIFSVGSLNSGVRLSITDNGTVEAGGYVRGSNIYSNGNYYGANSGDNVKFFSASNSITPTGNLTLVGTGTFNGAGNSYFAGNVGIGTASPNDKLEVLSTSDAQLRLAYDTSNYQALQVASDGGLTWSALGTDADLNFNFAGATDGDFSVNTDDLFVDTSTGYVGVGTASPTSMFSVGASSQFQVDSAGKTVASGGTVSPYTRVVYVDTGGKGDYTSVVSAIAAVSPTAANPVLIQVGPGSFSEPSAIVSKDHLAIRGAGIGKTIITSAVTNSITVNSGHTSFQMSDLTLTGGGSSGAYLISSGIYHRVRLQTNTWGNTIAGTWYDSEIITQVNTGGVFYNSIVSGGYSGTYYGCVINSGYGASTSYYQSVITTLDIAFGTGTVQGSRITTLNGVAGNSGILNIYNSVVTTFNMQYSGWTGGVNAYNTHIGSVTGTGTVSGYLRLYNGSTLGSVTTDTRALVAAPNSLAALDIESPNPALSPLSIEGAASQSANLFEVNSNGVTTGDLFVVSSVGNVGVGATTFGTNAAKVLAISGSTAPTTAITNGIQLFAVDQSGSHELRVMDEAANITTLSPHNFSLIEEGPSEDMAWSFYSERDGVAVNADMTKALRLIEAITGEKLIYTENILTGESIPYNGFDEDVKTISTKSTLLPDAEQAILGAQSPQVQPEEKLTTSGVLDLLEDVFQIDEVLTFLRETVFKARVVFKENVLLEKDLKVDGDVVIAGNINFDSSAVGTAVVLKDVASTTITFDQEFSSAPLIQLTPLTKVQGNYWIEEVTQKGFTIKFDEYQDEGTRFNWLAVMSSKNSIITGESTNDEEEAPVEPTTEVPEEEELPATEPTTPESTSSSELED